MIFIFSQLNINTAMIAPITSKHNKDDKKINICAPHRKGDEDTCYNTDELKEIANAINVYFSTEKMNKKGFKFIEIGDKKQLLKDITTALRDSCPDQISWLKKTFIRDKLKDKEEEIFLPEGPDKRYEWLSTSDIEKTTNLYQKKYPEFIFYGAVPMDFDEFPMYKIRNINYDELEKKGKTKIGIVFNLDYSHQSGSHWVALYTDLLTGEIYYFDSTSSPPTAEVNKLMNRIEQYLVGRKKNVTKKHNTTKHQKGGSECGVYSIIFILRMVQGDSFDDIARERMSDEVINQCRDLLFRNGPNIGGHDNQCKKFLRL